MAILSDARAKGKATRYVIARNPHGPTKGHIMRAHELARRIDGPAMVYRIDHEDTDRLAVGRLDYSDEPEFDAFDGRILTVVWPDGTIESNGRAV
ncbi:hypothetical protein LCGC14_0974310 [marine sediment metagenome]|uniref:Uncharacterized protein n=1 Tax=marine sediment metagenome TaxID=412755 RepID=A0A0F9QTY2_9ZZZZ